MISTGTRRHDLVGNNTTGPFTFQFAIPDKYRIQVYVDGSLKTLDTHYTVALDSDGEGGTVTFTSGNAPATNAAIILLGAESYTQDAAFAEAATLPAATLEAVLDKNVRLISQLRELDNRTPIMSVPDSYGRPPIQLGVPVAGQFVRWDSLGQNLESAVPTTTPSGLPVGGNYDHLTIDGTGTVAWGQQIYNFSTNWLNVSKYASFAAAVSAIGSTSCTLVITTNQTVAGNVSVPETLRLLFHGQGKLTISNGITVTFDNPDQILSSPREQVFAGAGTVLFTRSGTVHVGWWGAKPDGTTASATGIQAAITAAPENSVVVFQGGTYLVASTITINKERMVLKGAGRSSTKISSSVLGAPTFLYNSESIHNYIQDMWLSGNGLTGGSGNGHGIAFLDPTPDTGAYAPQLCYVLNCRIDGFKGNSSDGRGGTMLAAGIAQVSTLENTIRDCFIQDCQYGVYIDTCFTPRIYDSVIIDNDKYGVLALGSTGIIENLFMQGNDILANGDSSTVNQTGWTGAPTGNLYLYHVEGSCITGNKFKNGNLANVMVAFCKGVAVTGNWIRADNQYGAIFRACNGVTIDGNSFDCSVSTTNDPTYLTFNSVGGKDTNGISVRGNIFRFQGNQDITACIVIEGDASARRFQAAAIENNYFGDFDLVGPCTITNAISVVQCTLSACSISNNVFDAQTNATIACCFRTDANTNFIEFKFNGNQFLTGGGGTITNSKVIAVGTFAQIFQGTGSPESAVTAFIGSIYQRLNGGAGTSLYVKESGTGNTGWSDVA